MLLLLLSLFTYVLMYCSQETNAIFNESLLISQYRHNFHEIAHFMKDVKQNLQETSTLREGDSQHSTARERDFLGKNNTSLISGDTPSIDRIDRDILHTPSLPLIRQSHVFPFPLTPSTTDSNTHNLKWIDIFPDPTADTKPTQSLNALRMNQVTPKLQTLKPRPSETSKPSPKDQTPKDQKVFGPMSYNPKSREEHHKETASSKIYLPATRSGRFSITPVTTTTVTPTFNRDIMKIWLQEITTAGPIGKRVETSTSPTAIAPSSYKQNHHTRATQRTPDIARTPSATKTWVTSSNLQSSSKDQTPQIDTLSLILLPDKPIEVENYGHTTAQSFIEEMKGPYLRARAETKEDKKTTVVGEGPANIRSNTTVLIGTTAGKMVLRDKGKVTQKESLKVIRRRHSTVKAKNHHHSHRRNKEEQSEKPTEPTESSHAQFQFHIKLELDDEQRIKRRDESNNEKAYLYQKLKERLKAAESKKKAMKLMHKAALLRRIADGSSYSDEEASLRKNVVNALKDNISKNEVTQNDTTQTTPDYNEEEAITSNPPQKKKTKKIHMDHIISEADKKIYDRFVTLSNVLQQNKVEADECDLYASLLAKKLRKYPERMRNSIMYKIDGLLLDNPYPDERPSSASTFYSVPYQYTPTPSRQYTPTSSPQYAPTPSPQYAPNPSPQYVPNQNTTVTSEPPIYIRIPEENIRVQEDLGNQIHILSEEVIMPAKISNIITNAYNDS